MWFHRLERIFERTPILPKKFNFWLRVENGGTVVTPLYSSSALFLQTFNPFEFFIVLAQLLYRAVLFSFSNLAAVLLENCKNRYCDTDTVGV